MRTTLTLEEDVAAQLREWMQRSGRSLKDTVNTLLRLGLHTAERAQSAEPFVVHPHRLGTPAPGLNLDRISELLEQVEGPMHR